jgi:hypothetical protein
MYLRAQYLLTQADASPRSHGLGKFLLKSQRAKRPTGRQESSFSREEKYSVTRKGLQADTENRHSVVYSLVDKKPFKFDTTRWRWSIRRSSPETVRGPIQATVTSPVTRKWLVASSWMPRLSERVTLTCRSGATPPRIGTLLTSQIVTFCIANSPDDRKPWDRVRDIPFHLRLLHAFNNKVAVDVDAFTSPIDPRTRDTRPDQSSARLPLAEPHRRLARRVVQIGGVRVSVSAPYHSRSATDCTSGSIFASVPVCCSHLRNNRKGIMRVSQCCEQVNRI